MHLDSTQPPVTHHVLTLHVTSEELENLLVQMDAAHVICANEGLDGPGDEYTDLYNLLAGYLDDREPLAL